MNNLDDADFKKKLLERFPKRYVKETTYAKGGITPEFINTIDDDRLSLYVWGAVGTGKTQLVIDMLANEILEAKIDTVGYDSYYFANKIKFYNATELMAILRGLFDKKSSSENSFSNIEDFMKYITQDGSYGFEYIVIDDLGSEKQSEWVQETFYLLINKLYENESPNLIITSNKSINEIAESLGDRIASRLVEMCQIVKLEGKDRRLKWMTYK